MREEPETLLADPLLFASVALWVVACGIVVALA